MKIVAFELGLEDGSVSLKNRDTEGKGHFRKGVSFFDFTLK